MRPHSGSITTIRLMAIASRLLVLAITVPGIAHASCIGGGPVIQQICYADTGGPFTPSQWYFTGTDAFTGAQNIDQLTSLVQQEYSGIVNNSSITFVGGEAGFTSAALTKLTNVQAYAYISQLCFLTGPFDTSVEPSLGTVFGPATLTPQGPRSTCELCQSTFTTGLGKPIYSKFCVTHNGNIVQFEAPAGVEHLQSGVSEGYSICDMSPGGANYYDYGGFGDSTAWNPPIITQPNGANTFPLTIARTTADALWTLTQKFTTNTGDPSAVITMSLKNNSASPRSALLLRYADVDAHSNTNNRFDYTLNSAWGYVAPTCTPGQSCVSDFGLKLQAAPTTTVHGAFVQDSNGGPNACNSGALVPQQTPFDGDGSVFLQFGFQNIKKNATQTVGVIYRPL